MSERVLKATAFNAKTLTPYNRTSRPCGNAKREPLTYSFHSQPTEAAMVKILKEILPPGIIVAKETFDLITECGTEFVHLLSSQSVEVCEKAKRGIMTGEHVMEALKTLGFGAFLPVLLETNDQYERLHEEHEKKRKSFSKWGNLTEDQLAEMARQQQKMFEEAKLNSSGSGPTIPSPTQQSVNNLSPKPTSPLIDVPPAPEPISALKVSFSEDVQILAPTIASTAACTSVGDNSIPVPLNPGNPALPLIQQSVDEEDYD